MTGSAGPKRMRTPRETPVISSAKVPRKCSEAPVIRKVRGSRPVSLPGISFHGPNLVGRDLIGNGQASMILDSTSWRRSCHDRATPDVPRRTQATVIQISGDDRHAWLLAKERG